MFVLLPARSPAPCRRHPHIRRCRPSLPPEREIAPSLSFAAPDTRPAAAHDTAAPSAFVDPPCSELAGGSAGPAQHRPACS